MRFVCIHGHFYQPPRENPWLEAIEFQDSAAPYHDWNERITAECYRPNTAARLLDREGWLANLVNNYASISFNVGPTLWTWLEKHATDVTSALLEADRASRARFGGHGSAIAQAYNHMILPLANRHDKRTQVRWGLRDFEHRFERPAEGMWLPECAVDLETLDVLAEEGVRFTILAPHQAHRVRPLESNEWQDVSGARVNPTQPYLVKLPSGRSIAVFFYDGPISRAIAFEGLLEKGEAFVDRLMRAFPSDPSRDALVHIATDGETYGHHHRFGDMALAYALDHLESNRLARLTNYGEYLELYPPTFEVEIVERTSWSCSHGIRRWKEHCGCSTKYHPTWSQAWRGPVREALDQLRNRAASRYEELASAYFRDPWATRDAYIAVVLDRSPKNVDRFLYEQTGRSLEAHDSTRALKLLELQRHAMLMYTSCGWFFDDVAGIETVQILHYAARVLELATELFGASWEASFLEILARARSNDPKSGDGRAIYERRVRPNATDSLLRDEQRRILDVTLAKALADSETHYRAIHAQGASLSPLLVAQNIPIPGEFTEATRVVINADLRDAIAVADVPRIGTLLETARREHIRLDESRLASQLRHTLESTRPKETFCRLIELAMEPPFSIETWWLQSLVWRALHPTPSQGTSDSLRLLANRLHVR